MKQAIFGIGTGIMVIFLLLCVVTVESRTTRENELHTALSSAIDSAAEAVLADNDYTVLNDEEFAAAVTQELISKISTGSNGDEDPNLKVTVEVVEARVDMGILSLNVIEEFTNPDGTIGTTSCNKTVVLDREEQYPTYRIRYVAFGHVYKQYTINETYGHYPIPQTPEVDGKEFIGWSSEKNNGASDKIVELSPDKKIDGDATYYAIFKDTAP